MRKSVLMVFFLFVSYGLSAQEIIKQKEVGLVFSRLDNFGLTYRTGTDKSLWRFNTLFISGGNSEDTADSLLQKQSNSGFGVRIGKEYRKELVDNLEVRFGADLSFNYLQYKSDYNDKKVSNYDRYIQETTYTPGINLVFGFNYKLKNNFMIGAELLPHFAYTSGTSIEKIYYINNGVEIKSNISRFSYGLSNTSALLSLVYSFN